MGINKGLKRNQPRGFRDKTGFTLLEVMVVIGVIGLVVPTIFAITFSILRQQIKIIHLSQVKKEGDFVLNSIKNTIRNYAVSIHSSIPSNENKICDTPMVAESGNTLYFKDKAGTWFFYSLGNDKIASGSSSPPNAGGDLTSNKVKISQNGGNYFFSCIRSSAYSPPVITVNFKIEYNPIFPWVEETASLTYQTKIKLRSY